MIHDGGGHRSFATTVARREPERTDTDSTPTRTEAVVTMSGLCMPMAMSGYDIICSSTCAAATTASSRQLQSCQWRQATLPWRSYFSDPDGGEVSPLILRVRV
jgi:hypothetical protein